MARFEGHARRGSLEIKVGLSTSFRLMTGTRRRGTMGHIEGGDERYRFADPSVEEGEVDWSHVVSSLLGRPRIELRLTWIGMIDEFPGVGNGGSEVVGEEVGEARGDAVGEGFVFVVRGDDAFEEGEAEGGSDLEEAEDDVGTRVEECAC